MAIFLGSISVWAGNLAAAMPPMNGSVRTSGPVGSVPPATPENAAPIGQTNISGLILKFPLQMCTTPPPSSVGNLFPWINSSFFFGSYRLQYLWPSSTLDDLANNGITTIESIQSRAVSFTGAATASYAAAARFRVSTTDATTLVRTFSANTINPTYLLKWDGPFTVKTKSTPTGVYSDCSGTGCPNKNDLDTIIDLSVTPRPNLLVDMLMKLNLAGNSGSAVWDVSSPATCAGRRAYGSGEFASTPFLTTAYGIDGMAFVWTFKGLVCSPTPCFRTQLSETVRVLTGVGVSGGE